MSVNITLTGGYYLAKFKNLIERISQKEDPTQKVFWNPELVMFVESNLLTMGLALDHCTVPPFDF